jgi:uncharacterized protein YeaO (DUF488 family)
MLKTKCILTPREILDGQRISIMSKHTLNDGITPNPEITQGSYGLWIPKLSPPLKLLGDYYKRGLTWEEFEKTYSQYLNTPEIQKEIKKLSHRALTSNLILLCIELTPENCHRRILANKFKIYQPQLILDIN